MEYEVISAIVTFLLTAGGLYKYFSKFKKIATNAVNFLSDLSTSIKEIADTIETITKSLEDKRLTKKEIQKIKKELEEAIKIYGEALGVM